METKEQQDVKQEPNNNSFKSTNLNVLSEEMLKSTGEYIKGEIDMCIADYKTLEKMNTTVAEKYKSLSTISSSINDEMSKLNETYATLVPMLNQIDDLESCVNQLEQAANKLDAHSKKLEIKFKQFQEKNMLN
jgi:hypothetical protein